MISAKEKAKQLVDEFLPYVDWSDLQIDCTNRQWAIRNAKQCALTTVNELIRETGSKYYYDVKSEIEKL
jgi:hypothetical protein